MKFKIAVTGGNGFIGRKIVDSLINQGIDVISLQRNKKKDVSVEVRYFDLSKKDTINKDLLMDIDIVVHTAGLVHNNSAGKDQHNQINYDGTKRLFNIAKKSSVKKFIFISTVAVYGVNSYSSPIDINTKTSPQTGYAKAKLMAESHILQNSKDNIDVSVIRLPLVYGDNAPGNFGILEKISKTKLPLPFGMTNNKRSILSVELLSKFIIYLIKNPKKYNGLHIIAENPPISTKQIIIKLRSKYAISHNLIPVPKIIMKILLNIIGKKKVYEQLYEDLIFVSSVNIKKDLKQKTH